MIDEGHKQTEAEETTWSKDEEKHTVFATDEVDSEETAGAKGFANYAEESKSPCETDTHEKSVNNLIPHIIF